MPHATPRRSALAPACRLLGVSLVAASAWVMPGIAQPGDGFTALPAETVFALRLPNTQPFVDRLRDETVAGERIFTAERWEAMKLLMDDDESGDGWSQMTASLEAYGLTTEDVWAMLASNSGLGLVAQPRDAAADPRYVMLMWSDMGEEQIDKLYAALDKAAEDAEAEGEGDKTVRTDLDLAGLPVRQYMMAQVGPDREIDYTTPDDFWEKSEAEQQAFWDERTKMEEAVQYVPVDQTYMLVTRVPGRIVIGIGFPQSEDAVRPLLAQQQPIDWEVATDAATVQAVYARFLAGQQGGGEGAFAAKMRAVPGLGGNVGLPNTALEFYADGERLLAMAREAIQSESGEEQAAQYDMVMDALGFASLGALGGSVSHDGSAVQIRSFLQTPPQRKGLLAGLAASPMDPVPAPWVPANVSYGHISFDLSVLYDIAVDLATRMGGQEAVSQMQMVNMMVQGQTQADIPTILRALGTSHRFIVAEAVKTRVNTQEYDFETNEFVDKEVDAYMQPVAFVWDLQDAEVWNRVMTAIKGFSGMAGPDSGIATLDEQGFTGLSIDQQGTAMGLMLGLNKLVYGVGPDVTARTLSLLNNAPAPPDTLAGSGLMREGGALLELQPGPAFTLNSTSQDLISMIREIELSLDQSTDETMTPEKKERVRAVLPSDDDLRASFGASVGQVFFTADGLVYEAAVATPRK